jgi:hypothetical protein
MAVALSGAVEEFIVAGVKSPPSPPPPPPPLHPDAASSKVKRAMSNSDIITAVLCCIFMT